MNITEAHAIYSQRPLGSNASAGAVIMATAAALGHAEAPAERHDDDSGSSEGLWYPQARHIPVLDAIVAGRPDAMFDLIAIGVQIARRAALSDDINTLKRALFSLDDAYRLANPEAEGGWSVTLIDQNFAVCTSSTPFPSDLEYGILHGLAARFARPDQVFKVALSNPHDNRQAGGTSCTYHVRWGKRAR
jgi:hypothetical protein